MRGEPHDGQRDASGVARPQWWQRSVVAGLVVDERPLAVRAGLDVAAVPAQHDRRGPAPVEDEDRLLAAGRVERRRGRPTSARDSRPRLPAASSARRSTTSTVGALADRPRRQDDPVVVAGPGAADALDGRRRGPEHDRRAGQAGQLDRRVAGLEPRRPVALVGRVVLLVDDDHADVGQRRDDRQPRPDDDVDVAGADPAPLVGALAVAETRMDAARRARRGPRAADRPAAARARSPARARAPAGRPRAPPRSPRRRSRSCRRRSRRRAGAGAGRAPRSRRGPARRPRPGPGSRSLAAGRPPRRPAARAGERPARAFADLGLGQAAPDEPGDGRRSVAAGQVGRRQLARSAPPRAPRARSTWRGPSGRPGSALPGGQRRSRRPSRIERAGSSARSAARRRRRAASTRG